MRLKSVPEPPASLSFVGDAQRAVPLVPGSEDDCCARLMRQTGVEPRDEARRWLTFLRALELVAEHDAGFARERVDPEQVALRDAFERRVFAAREVLDALRAADEPLDAEAVFEQVVDVVPQWERNKRPTWREDWQDRVDRLLGWAVLLGLAERVDGGYRAVD
jgi:hypothetical protein